MHDAVVERIRQCFSHVPSSDRRSKIGPRSFLVFLVCSLADEARARTIERLRRNVMEFSEQRISRGAFWERLAAKRLLSFLCETVRQLVAELADKVDINGELLLKLGVSGVYLLDGCITTLGDKAASDFPAPRNNVAPAGIKWHLLLNVLSGVARWFEITDACQHDRKSFPPLELLKGALIIFDLGYWDYQLMADLADAGCYFLSRIKSSATIEIIGVTERRYRKFLGGNLLEFGWSKFQGNVIEFVGSLALAEKDTYEGRVLGFWNPAAKTYHWYITNLTVAATIIYPLYRLRWQVELAFKAAKGSLDLADIPSANINIILSLTLVSIVASLIGQPLARAMLIDLAYEKQVAVSFQRAAMVLVHVSSEVAFAILSRAKQSVTALRKKLLLYQDELYDPNHHRRKSSLRAVMEASC